MFNRNKITNKILESQQSFLIEIDLKDLKEFKIDYLPNLLEQEDYKWEHGNGLICWDKEKFNIILNFLDKNGIGYINHSNMNQASSTKEYELAVSVSDLYPDEDKFYEDSSNGMIQKAQKYLDIDAKSHKVSVKIKKFVETDSGNFNNASAYFLCDVSGDNVEKYMTEVHGYEDNQMNQSISSNWPKFSKELEIAANDTSDIEYAVEQVLRKWHAKVHQDEFEELVEKAIEEDYNRYGDGEDYDAFRVEWFHNITELLSEEFINYGLNQSLNQANSLAGKNVGKFVDVYKYWDGKYLRCKVKNPIVEERDFEGDMLLCIDIVVPDVEDDFTVFLNDKGKWEFFDGAASMMSQNLNQANLPTNTGHIHNAFNKIKKRIKNGNPKMNDEDLNDEALDIFEKEYGVDLDTAIKNSKNK